MELHTAPWKNVTRVVFTPDGASVLAACNPGGVVRFEPGTAAPVARHKGDWESPHDLDVHPAGAWAVTACGIAGLEFLSLPDLAPLHSRAAGTKYAEFARVAPDGGSVLAYHFRPGALASPFGLGRLRVNTNFTTTQVWVRATQGWFIRTACFAGRFAAVGETRGWTPTDPRRLALCDAESGKLVRTRPFQGVAFDQLTASPDARRMCLRVGPKVLVWELDEPGGPATLGDGRLHVTGVAWHPSGKYLAAAGNDETVTLYDADSWQIAKTYTWAVGRLKSVCFSPDGTLAAVGSDTGRVVVWDVDV
jgi:WD40 repeat protein